MSNPESVLQAEIRLALGRDPSLVLWRNAVGQAEHVAGNGRTFRQAFGLAKGASSPPRAASSHSRSKPKPAA